MKEKYKANYQLFSTSEFEGIYVYMSNSEYKDGDVRRNINCSEYICWAAYLTKLDEFINLVGSRKKASMFISKMVRDKNKDKLDNLLKVYPRKEVDMMLFILDEYIKLMVVEDFFNVFT